MRSKLPRLPKVGAILILLMSAESCILALAGLALLVLVVIGLYVLAPLPQPSLPAATLAAVAPRAQPPLGTDTPTPSPTYTPTPLPSDTPTATPTYTPMPSAQPPLGTPSPLPSDSAQPPLGTPTAVPTHTPAPAPTKTPAPPTETPTPTPPPYDFIVVHQRLWTNEENGGTSPGGSVSGCGYGHEIYVWVMDAAGAPLDGMVIGDTYNNPRHISGEKGPGHAQYDLYMNGYRLLVVEDNNAGRPVTSEVSEVMSGNDWEIPVPWLIQGHYCATEEECLARRADPNKPGGSGLCWGHYSYEIIFQRTW
jgi:hypothetical protein